MYPSSVVSNVNVKRKHPSWCLYTKHKNIFKKQYFFIAISYASYLLSVHDVIACHQRGYGYIHICTRYLIKWMRQPLNLMSERWWRLTELRRWFSFHCQDSGLSHLISQCSSIWNKNYQQINKNVKPSQTLSLPHFKLTPGLDRIRYVIPAGLARDEEATVECN